MGQPALALTDHGTMSGALHHIRACWNKDEKGKPVREGKPIVPISAVEAYFRPDRAAAKAEKNRQSWHLCLYAKNLTGWHNLLRLVSTAYAEVEDGGGFYDDPCVDWFLLERFSEGLACSTACISSWLSHLIDLGHSNDVRTYLARMQKIFGDDLWVEIMPHDFDDQRTLNKHLVMIAQEFSIPLVATNDAHFPYKEWAETHRVVKLMGSGSSFEKAKADAAKGKAAYLADLNPTLYLCSEQDMRDWFAAHHPDLKENVVSEAIGNTWEMARGFMPFLLDTTNKLPKADKKVDVAAKLQEWIAEGMDRIREDYEFEHWDRWSSEDYWDRIHYEWEVLESKGVLDYFYMVADIVRWARSEGIRVGLGRGSAAGCLISYLIGIVRVDPIPYDLLFERFLNPNRKGLPDIDLDFQSDRRHEVKAYIAMRYGRDHVADIITHSRFQPKNLIQGLGRTFDLPYTEVKKVTDTIEIRQDDEETTIPELVPINEKLAEFLQRHEDLATHADRLEGMVANAGKHAAGVIITPKPIADYMALERGKSGDLVTSWSDAADFAALSDNGFVKIDALGIKGLERHEYACKLIYERTGEVVDLYDLPVLHNPYLTDARVMEGFRKGLTKKVFQYGSRGMTKLIKDIQPDTIFDLSAANALYRPGPMGSGVTWEYAKRKHNPMLRQYLHPDLKEWLEETYGLIAYQEQVMRISSGIGRMSGADADDLRKAMGKLYRIKGGTAAKDFMRQYEIPFFDGAMKDRGWDHETAEMVWNMFLEFGHYGFNKSHSCSYALQAYQDMYLKMLYPFEFYAAALTFEEDESEIKAITREAHSLGVQLVPPKLNTSGPGYTTTQADVDAGVLQMGLVSIKGVGLKAAAKAIENRPYTSIEDLLARGKGVPFRPVIESGAIDDIADRQYLLSVVTRPRKGEDDEWQVWEHLKHNTTLAKPRDVPEFRREPAPEMVEALRLNSFTVPLKQSKLSTEVADYLRENCHLGSDFDALEDGDYVICGGEITSAQFKQTNAGKDYANIRIAFESDEWSVKFWQETLQLYGHILVEGAEVMVAGRLNIWNDFRQVVAQHVVTIEEYFKEEEEVHAG